MVFQASTNSKKTTGVGADFKDLELVKQAENKSIQEIANASKRANKIIAKAKQDILENQNKSISELKNKLDKKFELDENKAKAEALNIIKKGDEEANNLKQELMGRVPEAVEYIVNAIIGDQ